MGNKNIKLLLEEDLPEEEDVIEDNADEVIADLKASVGDAPEWRKIFNQMKKEQIEGTLYISDDEDTQNELFRILDTVYIDNVKRWLRAKKHNPNSSHEPHNLLIEGDPGSGKTDITMQWARSRHVKLVIVTGSDVDEHSTKGLPDAVSFTDAEGNEYKKVEYLPSGYFDELGESEDSGPIILFLDELNRAPREAHAALLTLIWNHTIQDTSVKGRRKKFENFVFTIAAINPRASNPEVEPIGGAMGNRVSKIGWYAAQNKASLLGHIKKNIREEKRLLDVDLADGDISQEEHDFDYKKWQGRENIITAILESDDFRYSTSEEVAEASANEDPFCSPRSLEIALLACDGTVGKEEGDSFTEDSFLYWYLNTCGTHDILTVQNILARVPDADDIANSAKAEADSIAKKRKGKLSGMDALQGLSSIEDNTNMSNLDAKSAIDALS